MANTGELNKIITLQTPIMSRDEFGSEVKKYNFYKKTWAKVLPISSNKRFLNNEKKSIEINRFIVRYNSTYNENMIINYRDRVFKITGILLDTKNNYTELLGESIE